MATSRSPRSKAAPAALSRLARHAPSGPTGPTRWVLDVPFEWRAWASTQGIVWDAEAKASVWTGASLPVELLPFAARPFSWEWRQQKLLNPNLVLSVPEVLPKWSARSHQAVASAAIQAAYRAKRIGFLLADEVGLGKTISAWDFVLGVPAFKKALVVTTSAAVPHWRNTIQHTGHGEKDVLVINYDRLGKLFDVSAKPDLSNRRKGKRKRLANKGEPEVFDVIIFDEAHKGKNLTSARSIMMRRLGNKAKFVIWASATAGQNPLELAYLAPLLAQVTGHRLSEMTEDFEAWCKEQDIGVSRGKFGRWEWRKSTGALKKVNGWLFGGPLPAGIRRLPQDISGWKAMERQVAPQALGPQERKDYTLAWQEFKAQMAGQQVAKTASKKREIGLVSQLRFRQKSSWLRVPSTLDLIADHLDNGKRVAVSMAFHDSLNEMARQLTAAGIEPAIIHGGLSPVEKEAQRLRFQKGQTPVVLFTVEEAISLHEGEHEDVPRVLLVHDLRWSALQMAQIEGRCHRDGKFAPTLWLFAEGTVEEDIAQVLMDRVIAMKTMHGDDVSDLEAIEKVLANHKGWAKAA